jgi:transpeptidase family protein/MecA-like transpeptidase family protein/penicillin-binding protein
MSDPTVLMGYGSRRRRRRGKRRIIILVVVLVLVLALAAAIAGYLLLRTVGSPQQTASTYLQAWEKGDYPAMGKVSVGAPPGGLAGPLQQAAAQLGMRRIHLALGQVTPNGGAASARFTASADLASGHVWTYRGQLALVQRDRHWWVNWTPAAIYPGLRAGQRFVLSAVWPARGQVLGADGTVLSSPQAIAQSGSLSLLTGDVVAATAEQAKALGAPYQKGDLIGQGGIEQAYQARLAGRPALVIRIEGPGKKVDATAARFPATPGRSVQTSVDMRYQLAAAHAVAAVATTKKIDMVVLQPSTGRVLAVIERPGGYDRALQGIFPPGSTFKIVTASALTKKGLRPSTTVQCPPTVDIGGRTFHNFDNEHLGATTLLNAFAVSCNTTFAMLASQHLTGAALRSMAEEFGFNQKPALGIPAVLGRFSTPHQPVDLAADAFGQGTDLVSPLSQATAAAAIEDGAWRPPQLVVNPAPPQTAQPHKLSPALLDSLRPMMRAVVTRGTAAGVGFPPGVYGKTGTAEYGSGPNPPSHAWFIGYRGDLAFAVLVEGGGVGADASAPIASAFLHKV